MIVVPAHRRVRTDQLAMGLEAGQTLAVSIYSPDSGSPRCQVAPVLSYFTAPGGGDAGARRDARDYPTDEVRLWAVWLDEVQVLRHHNRGAIVAVGDSITAGLGVPVQRHWVTRLARTEAPRGVAVIDAGIPGDGLTHGTFGAWSMAARARAATRWPGVTTVLLQGGVNDLGRGERAAPVIHALASAARAARRRGVTIIGMTVTPFVTYPASRRAPESARLTINRWIRRTHLFDAVVDLDRLLDRGRPGRLDPRYDAGRGVHPNAVGDARILEAVKRALRAAGRRRDLATR